MIFVTLTRKDLQNAGVVPGVLSTFLHFERLFWYSPMYHLETKDFWRIRSFSDIFRLRMGTSTFIFVFHYKKFSKNGNLKARNCKI